MRDYIETRDHDDLLPTGGQRRYSPNIDEDNKVETAPVARRPILENNNVETVLVARRPIIERNILPERVPAGKPVNPSIVPAAGFQIKGAAKRQQEPRRFAPYPLRRNGPPGGKPSGPKYMPPRPKSPRRPNEGHTTWASAVRQGDEERLMAQGPPRPRRTEPSYTFDEDYRHRP
ncbi:hypothetical protein LTS15_007197 [Exophiala xenobiotica]|nr:hypothetical protein LTS15_007197 [Exophiala xenobiotica]